MSFGKFNDSDNKKTGAASDKQKSKISFENKKGNTMSEKTNAFLGKGSKVSGTLTFQGPVEIGGEIEGEIHASDTLVIAESAIVKAKVVGTDILIKGQVTGDIIASKKLSLEKPGKVNGNLSSPVLRIEEGVVFEGNCSMSSANGKSGTASASAQKA